MGLRNPKHFPTRRPRRAGAALAPVSGEVLVFRAAVLSIVLALAVGPNAALLCSVWCHPVETQSSACPHQGGLTSSRVTGEDSCRTAPGATSPVVREEGTTGALTGHGQHDAVVGAFRFDVPVTDSVGTSQPGYLLDRHVPLVLTALRI